MNISVFTEQFNRLTSWFNKKMTSDQARAWFERVKEIPDEAFPKLVDHLCDSAKYFPTPQDVRNLFEDWLASHPERRSMHNRTWCDDCGGTGAIRVHIQESYGFTRDTMYRCRACRNWEGSLGTWVPIRYLSEIEHMPKTTILRHAESRETEQTVPNRIRIPEKPRGGMAPIKDVIDIPF